MDSLSAANTQFSLNLFKKISETNTRANVFYSPLSISSALAMVSLGAKGNTQDQILKVLCLNKEEDYHSSFNKLMSGLNKPGDSCTLSLANRLYGEKSFQFIDKFISDSQKYYQAGLESVDFKTNAEAERVNINNWVEKQTQGKIIDLLPKGIVDDQTSLVLINAIYLKAVWAEKFPPQCHGAEEQQFRLNKNETKPVKMMNQKTNLPLTFISKVKCQIVELPYVGKNLSMLIILPKDIKDDTTGLQKLEKTLTYEKLMDWTKPEKMSQVRVDLSLPKFRLEETYDVKSLLKSLGMVDAFEFGTANFSGMSTNSDLMLSDVIHKSFIDVDEDGTEAAAATATVATRRGSAPRHRYIVKTEVFNADHPFLFFIRHNPTNSIVCFGRFCSP
ncbi:Leukocyte elastase inhibitor [Triplophysa tibetana]|uniref:Leukocyte elastase inhibitor n=1 Tax=Triplophysa tibetana TaxID=1572043 RepID=A0A5A9N012_9TELE|nr:Leukocyte elastase inhibitor [Triplophysa tibetana]